MPELATLVKRLVDSYETLNPVDGRGKICSFTLVSGDGLHSNENLTDICHADLKYVVPNKYDVLLTSYPANAEVDFRFFIFMIGRLYKKWAQYIHLEKAPETKLGKDLYYIRITDLDKIPANVVYNFCICSRVIVEFRRQLEVWDELVLQHELDPVVAFAVCLPSASLGKPIFGKKVNSVAFYEGHWPFDNTVDLSCLINGKPILTSVPYKESPQSCAPTNCIWGKTLDLRSLEGSTIRKFWNEWKEKCPN